MTTPVSLIEALEALKTQGELTDFGAVRNSGIDDCIAILRSYTPRTDNAEVDERALACCQQIIPAWNIDEDDLRKIIQCYLNNLVVRLSPTNNEVDERAEFEKLSSQLIKIAADLLTGEWISHHREDMPPTINQKFMQQLLKDSNHRGRLSRELKGISDALREAENTIKPAPNYAGVDNAAYSTNDRAKAADSALSPAPNEQPVQESPYDNGNWVDNEMTLAIAQDKRFLKMLYAFRDPSIEDNCIVPAQVAFFAVMALKPWLLMRESGSGE